MDEKEMHQFIGEIKSDVGWIKTTLKDHKQVWDKHCETSETFRDKVTILWRVMCGTGWIGGLILVGLVGKGVWAAGVNFLQIIYSQ